METKGEHVDKPEPRWQVILALLAVGGIYMALPKELVLGPTWLLPVLIIVLLVPTVFAHRSGYHSLNHVLGILISGIITVALVGSVVLLVANLPAKRESSFALLRSGAELWLTNVLVFALWYWRLDGGGPTARAQRRRSSLERSSAYATRDPLHRHCASASPSS